MTSRSRYVTDTKKTGGDVIMSVIFNFLKLTSKSFFFFFFSGLNLPLLDLEIQSLVFRHSFFL